MSLSKISAAPYFGTTDSTTISQLSIGNDFKINELNLNLDKINTLTDGSVLTFTGKMFEDENETNFKSLTIEKRSDGYYISALNSAGDTALILGDQKSYLTNTASIEFDNSESFDLEVTPTLTSDGDVYKMGLTINSDTDDGVPIKGASNGNITTSYSNRIAFTKTKENVYSFPKLTMHPDKDLTAGISLSAQFDPDLQTPVVTIDKTNITGYYIADNNGYLSQDDTIYISIPVYMNKAIHSLNIPENIATFKTLTNSGIIDTVVNSGTITNFKQKSENLSISFIKPTTSDSESKIEVNFFEDDDADSELTLSFVYASDGSFWIE